jgi:hypothetical protein
MVCLHYCNGGMLPMYREFTMYWIYGPSNGAVILLKNRWGLSGIKRVR